MHSDLIGKIEKARRYAQEPERVALDELKARFHGGNNEHQVTLNNGQWNCDCEFFRTRKTCAHIMAMQKLFNPMLSEQAREIGQPIAEEHIAVSVS